MTATEIENLGQRITYLRGETANCKGLYSNIDSQFGFVELMSFLAKEENRYLMKELVSLAADINA